MNKPYPMKRILIISEDIDSGSVKNIIQSILDINEDDNRQENEYKDWDRLPIQLFINSYGGVCYDGLALIDIIKSSKTPVHTICIGSCMSMGLWIFLAGHKRLIGENATLMFHDLSLNCTGEKTEYFKQELEEMERLQEMYCNEIIDKSLVTEDILNDYIIRKAEWYIPSKKAIQLQLADEIYKG